MTYTDLFIDFDDTLYDTHGNATLALHELYAEFGLGRYFPSEEAFIEPYWHHNVLLWTDYAAGRITRPYLILERFRRPLALGMPSAPTDDYLLRLSDRFLELCSDKPGTLPGAHRLMRYLKAKGYRTHLCSNGFHEVQYRKLRASRLIDFFDTVILSEDAGANKPQPEYFAYALQQSHAEQATTLMIGDNFVSDIEGAQRAGLDTLFYNAHPDTFQAPHPVTYEVSHLLDIIGIL